MFKELDELISQEVTVDFWYDEGFDIAQNMLMEFSFYDWKELLDVILFKDLEWQKKLIYCFDFKNNINALKAIEKLLLVDDDELFEMCIDALRCFDSIILKEWINKHKIVIKIVKNKLDKSTTVLRKIFEIFLNNI